MARTNGHIFLLLLLAGVGIGLYVGWVAYPLRPPSAPPAALHPVYKDDYVLMIATAYTGDGDLDVARAELARLGFDEPGPAVASAAGRLLAAGAPPADLARLARLAGDLGSLTPGLAPYLTPTAAP